MDRDELVEFVEQTLDAYFTEVHPEDTESEDLAESLVRALEQRFPGAVTR